MFFTVDQSFHLSEQDDAVLTHETSIGKLAEDEINDLQARGFTNDEAVSLFVRGFLTTDIHRYMPEQARRYIKQIENLIVEKAL